MLVGERVVANNCLVPFNKKKTEFLTLMHRAKGMLRNNSCALIDEAGMLLCYVMFELCLGSFMASCFFQKSMEISDPSFAVEYGHAYGNYVYI